MCVCLFWGAHYVLLFALNACIRGCCCGDRVWFYCKRPKWMCLPGFVVLCIFDMSTQSFCAKLQILRRNRIVIPVTICIRWPDNHEYAVPDYIVPTCECVVCARKRVHEPNSQHATTCGPCPCLAHFAMKRKHSTIAGDWDLLGGARARP